MKTRVTFVVGLAVAFGTLAPATAQRIEISSQSLGTVVVEPAPIAGTAPAQVRIPAQSGIDLGLRRNPDGSLYDPLAQPPERARAGTNGAAPGRTAMNRTSRPGQVGAGAAGSIEPGGLPPGGRYGNDASTPAGANGAPGAGRANDTAGDGGAATGTGGAIPAGTSGFTR